MCGGNSPMSRWRISMRCSNAEIGRRESLAPARPASRGETKMITRRALAGLGPGLVLPASLRAQGTKVEIGFVPGTDFVPALIAQDKGYFAKDGMDAHCTI